MAQRTGQYEGLFLFGTTATVDPEASVRRVGEIVTRHGADILHLRKWDERRLAYEIRKNKRGLYVLCFFSAPSTVIEKINRDVNLSEDVLRCMITDASHYTIDEMKAMEPQQPVREVRREEFISPVSAI
jgi:small subunit ribosomal protein S6